jgi:hypothetical protein
MIARRTRVPRGPGRIGYPALRAFCRGYLHEDAVEEHGSAAGAVQAFRADASAREQRALEADWRRFASDTAGWPLERVADQLRRTLGAAWQPATAADLAALAAALAPASESK